VIRIEESVEINRPVEEVFSYATTPEDFPEWLGNAIDVRKDALGPLRGSSSQPSRSSWAVDSSRPSRSLPASRTGATRIGVREVQCRLP
jgi:uncharacterized membrane protein